EPHRRRPFLCRPGQSRSRQTPSARRALESGCLAFLSRATPHNRLHPVRYVIDARGSAGVGPGPGRTFEKTPPAGKGDPDIRLLDVPGIVPTGAKFITRFKS